MALTGPDMAFILRSLLEPKIRLANEPKLAIRSVTLLGRIRGGEPRR